MGFLRFTLDNGKFEVRRKDFSVENSRGMSLQCTAFEPAPKHRKSSKMPVVIYCHGSSGSRRDPLYDGIVDAFLLKDICVVSFDFSGSGQSEGDNVSLGHYEKDDLSSVVDYVRASGRFSAISLWGFSMGAVTAILYASGNPDIASLFLDSPFSDLEKLLPEIAKHHIGVGLPDVITKKVIKGVRKAVLKPKRGGFDLTLVRPLEAIKAVYCPVFFVHGKRDTLIHPYHSRVLCAAAAEAGCSAFFLEFSGDHNSERPLSVLDQGVTFTSRCLLTGCGLGVEQRTPLDDAAIAAAATAATPSASPPLRPKATGCGGPPSQVAVPVNAPEQDGNPYAAILASADNAPATSKDAITDNLVTPVGLRRFPAFAQHKRCQQFGSQVSIYPSINIPAAASLAHSDSPFSTPRSGPAMSPASCPRRL
jgi:pimeloyl-ACP methyl ester carboxylesterase